MPRLGIDSPDSSACSLPPDVAFVQAATVLYLVVLIGTEAREWKP
jgi:hypothetical protein